MARIGAARRDFIKQSAAGLALTAMPKVSFARESVRRYQLVAEPHPHFFDYKLKATDLWLYNGKTPGPLITAVKNEILEVEVVNNLDQPTTVHWHGIRNINEMDGVPGLTQPAIQPGEKFRYRFSVKDAGTFWYHAHNKAWQQVARGLYGPLIVHNPLEQNNSRDVLIVADDWLIDKNEQIDADSFGSLGHWSHGGRLGNALSINGKFGPSIPIPSSGTTKLKFINAANARVLKFALEGNHQMRVASVDGSPCENFITNEITIGPAQRLDIEVDEPSNLTSLLEISTSQTLKAAKFEPVISTLDKPLHSSGSRPYYNQPDVKNAKIVEIHMQGGAMGNLSSATFNGEIRELRDLAMNESKLWAFNGEIGDYGLTLAEVQLQDIVVLRVWNDTAWRHSMHLHGHHFWVQSREFGENPRNLLRDTYLMQPREKADLIFIADNHGRWLFHCHMLEHHASGMGGLISVV